MTDKTPSSLADDAAEAVGALSRRTQDSEGGQGWQQPEEACATVGALVTMAMRLPEVFDQICAFIEHLEFRAHLRSNRDTLESDLLDTYAGLVEAKEAAERLHAALSLAQSGLRPLAYKS
ncbi:hypothetical protein C3486_04130 [Streptomyces sp. Ru73]|uniref:hypothetical protein n=1 Tax=Streptomyces sp. Ru73 TaxID=2080748 RepID=UPI000CDD7DA8|nr:hypothetical protein [Streptomyces sp. Ru73]POX42762.1 hypothetical protein C3486_04130 [Streptomyces sp. Ru73]